MDYTISASVFSLFWDLAAAELFAAMSEMLFYGILLVLVAFAVNLLWRRQAGARVLLISTAVMFVFATVQFGARLQATVKAFDVFYLAVQGEFSPQSARARDAAAQNLAFNFLEDVLLVTNNAFTDGVLIYRCFLIWGSNYYVIIAPSLMLLLTSILSYISAYEGDYPSAAGPSIDLRIGFALSVLTNIVLVGLTAGRILHTRRVARRAGMRTDVRRFNTAVAMVLESGAILCAWVVVYVILRSISPPTTWRVFRGGLAMLLNIVPTMIIVRIGLGHAIDSESTKISSGNWKKESTDTV
ncbi:hypothetical protein B0H19DRAFT_1174632 [Mycena capillaripes]|nr:hypothetical protein B0H19DRAFT_1174632 [Mycena capillaripes]